METKNCQNCKKNFTIAPDDFSFYEKMKVPAPTFCPSCRNQRRLSWRNDTSLYKGVCGLCGKSIISLYSPESRVITYCNKCWWSDNWDPMSYGQTYDFNRPFFEQFKEFILKIPHLALVNDNGTGSINAEYTQDFSFAKNCYMVFVAWHIENVMYSYYLIAGKDIMDSMNVMSNSQWLYECIQPEECYRVKYSHFVISCLDSAFLYDCKNCSNSLLCSGLRNKKYCYKNQQYSKEEYEKIVEDYKLDTFTGVERAQKEFDEFILSTPRRFALITHSVNCTGDLLNNGKNSTHCFNVQNPDTCKWIDNADTLKDSLDVATSGMSEQIYEGITCDNSSRNLFGLYSWKNQNIEYTHHCHSSSNLFACVALRSKQYCILNTQYSKEEYEILKNHIEVQMNTMPYIDAMGREYRYGEFYPSELSHFGYNETIAQERIPLSKDKALAQGLLWQDTIQRTIDQETIQPEQISDSISGVEDSILNEILVCIQCKRNYKIVPGELEFYRYLKIPIPRRCFHCRHGARIQRRNPFMLWHRSCMCKKEGHDHSGECMVEFETTYDPKRPEIIYCEKCYQQEFN